MIDMIARILMVASAAIIGALGCGHLLLTYRGPKLLPRDPSLREAMERVSPVITSQTTIWKAWMGFNVSHSMGAILYGLMFGYLAAAQPEILFQSIFLQAVGLAMVLGFFVLAKIYWFTTPLLGSTLSLILYVASVALAAAG